MRTRMILAAASAAVALGAASRPVHSATSPAPAATRGAPPVRAEPRFVENVGQAREDAAFATFGAGPPASLSRRAMTFAGVSIAFDGARDVAPRGESPTPAAFHSFLGKDGAARPRHARSFGAVVYDEPWPGVDLRFDASPASVEYSLVVHAGADVSAARFVVGGAERLETTPDGGLAATTSSGRVTQSRPIAWQEIDGARRPVAVAFDVEAPTYRFRLGVHDASRPVVIDPTIRSDDFTLGFSGEDYPAAVAVDPSGNVYVAARVASPGLVPAGRPSYKATLSGSYDGFLAKYDDGGQLVWATYFGSSGDDDNPTDVAVDAQGRPVVVGYTRGTDFPATAGFSTGQSSGAFVTRFAADGASLLHSNLFGMDYPGGFHVAVGPGGAAYAAGVASAAGIARFTSTTSVIGAPGPHAYTWVAKIAPNGQLGYLTELWGAASGYGTYVGGIAVDSAGGAYLTGTASATLPPAAVTNSFGGAQTDAFAMKLDPSGQTLEYAVFVGGSGMDYGGGIAVDATGAACLVGETTSSVATFPRRTGDDGVTSDAQPGGGFFAKLSPSGQNQVFALGLSASVRDAATVATAVGVAFDETGAAWTTMESSLLRVSSGGALVETFSGGGRGRPAVRSSHELWLLGLNRDVRRLTDPGQGVPVPTSVTAHATSARTARVDWNGVAGASGYVVERANATGGFVSVASPDATARSFDDSGLSPDTNYRYRVRAVAAGGPSSPSPAVAVRTNGSFSLRVTKARIVDSTKSKKDSIKLAATTSFESPTAFDPATDAFHLSIGEGGGAFVLDVVAGDSGWKGKSPKFRWRSRKGGTRRVALALDLKRGRTSLKVTKTDLAGLPADPAEVEIRAGDEADTDGPVWRRSGDAMKTP